MKNEKAKELFSATYMHIYFAKCTAEHAWWLNDQGKNWWNGVYTFSCDILYFVREGEFDLWVDGIHHRMKPGQMIYLPAGTEHERKICSKRPLRKYYCHFDLMFGKDPLSSFFRTPRITEVRNVEAVTAVFETLCGYHRKSEHAFAIIGGNGTLLHLLSLFLEETAAEFLPKDSRADRSMQTVVQYIHANLHRTMTVAELAELANYSPDHFTKIFKKFFNCLPLDYISNVKLVQAKKQLRETRLSISAIAEELGFCDASYFGRFFKKHTDISPAQYRKTVRYTV